MKQISIKIIERVGDNCQTTLEVTADSVTHANLYDDLIKLANAIKKTAEE